MTTENLLTVASDMQIQTMYINEFLGKQRSFNKNNGYPYFKIYYRFSIQFSKCIYKYIHSPQIYFSSYLMH